MKYRIGVDVGGTFTDFLVSGAGQTARVYKSSTTPDNPSVGFFAGLEQAARDQNLSIDEFLSRTETIVHGTTITTNAVLTSTGARTGFLTTKGFRDVLNMRRGLKERQFERYAPPPPLVPRSLICPIDERVTVTGDVERALNEDEVRAAARHLRDAGVEAVAVSYLWSFLNPAHELRTREILNEELPGSYISLSVEVLPQIRVYERHSTTALNAYTGPILSRYLAHLTEDLKTRGYHGTLLIMQSNGGVMSPEVAQRFASNTLLSGPAGAPGAGVFYGATHGFRDVITIDMGGTSFDVALVRDRRPSVTTDGAIGGHRIASPILDIHTIGAGGGSIARVDSGGLLGVGPASAGAKPGPACYGRGGTLPTVTDADFVLGYLDGDAFHGGQLKLDRAAAEHAIEEHVAKPLGMSLVQAADGIYQVINANMAAALSVVSVQRGLDPREFVLIVAGGAGPIHAAPIARELDIPLVLIPRQSSVFCAAGMLISDLQHDYVRTYARDVSKVDVKDVTRLFKEMAQTARHTLRQEHVADRAIEVSYSADLRYVGQFNEVEVPVEFHDTLTPALLEKAVARFHQQHDSLYGYAMHGAPAELINLRVTAKGVTPKPRFTRSARTRTKAAAALLGKRDAWFDGKWVPTPVYDALKLHNGHEINGPAIVQQATTTIIVPPEFDLHCDEFDNYLMHRKGVPLAALMRRLKSRS